MSRVSSLSGIFSDPDSFNAILPAETPKPIIEKIKTLFFTIYCRLYRAYHTCFIIQVLCSLYYSLLALTFGKKTLKWKTHWQSPVCSEILRRKHFLSHSKSSLLWAIFYFSLATVLLFDLKSNIFMKHFIRNSDLVWYFELTCVSIVLLNGCIAFIIYIMTLFTKPMQISPKQQKLFGIREVDTGFRLKKQQDYPEEKIEKRLLFTSWHDSDQSALSVTPLNYSAKSWASSPSYCLDTSSSSWSYSPRFGASSPNSYQSSPKIKQGNSFVTRKSLLYSPSENPIRSSKQLEDFLKACEDEEKLKLMSFEDNVTSLDRSPLSKCLYQRACLLPSTETIENNSLETHFGDTLHKLKITEKMLTSWCERFRKWVCQTILVKLVAEIADINNCLNQMGAPEYQIGTVNLFALHQIAVTKFQQLTSLPAVLPYLDMHLNQEYLVQRLKDLAKGGCLSNYKWNSGGSMGDKPWCDDLPTDAAIILHVLCCYLDAYLPPEPYFPEGKPFSTKYFKKTPEKFTLSKDTHFIYQSSIIPPHFKVILGQNIYSLPKGRNNLFHAFLIFVHYLKTKECSMLGKMSLGPSGLNLLWVID